MRACGEREVADRNVGKERERALEDEVIFTARPGGIRRQRIDRLNRATSRFLIHVRLASIERDNRVAHFKRAVGGFEMQTGTGRRCAIVRDRAV